MTLEIQTHEVTLGGRCGRCGTPLAEYTALKLHVGDRLGKIVAPKSGAVVVYHVGERDSNELCKEVA